MIAFTKEQVEEKYTLENNYPSNAEVSGLQYVFGWLRDVNPFYDFISYRVLIVSVSVSLKLRAGMFICIWYICY